MPAKEENRQTLTMGATNKAGTTRHRSRRWLLRLVGMEPPGRTVVIGPTPVVVGAHGNCDLILSDKTVSRQHAQLRLVGDGVRVEDLNSTNGTFHQSTRITDVVLATEAALRFGETHARLEREEGGAVEPSAANRFGGLVGESRAMREVFSLLELASPTRATVLLEGESGTGKEIAARALHDHSMVANGPFVVVECSALVETLVESHLFGHSKGAFTGAVSDRRGSFEQAHDGTVFLDEIGELPLSTQSKLLRVLETGTVQPIGSESRRSVNVRVVAATHRDLDQMVNEGTFRFDLFHRLSVIHICLPPLRERQEDVSALVRDLYEREHAKPGELQGENLRRLLEHDWPGNVRELRNVLERAWVLTGGQMPFKDLRIQLRGSASSQQHIPIHSGRPYKEAKERILELFEEAYVGSVFEASDGNITQAAERAGLTRKHMRTLLRKYGLVESSGS